MTDNDSFKTYGLYDEERRKQFGDTTHELISRMQRYLFKAEDEGFPFDPFRTIANMLYDISKGDVLKMFPPYREVNHYLAFYKERDEWYEKRKFRTIAISSNCTFGDGEYRNTHFGCPEGRVMSALAKDIVNATNLFLYYFDTPRALAVPRETTSLFLDESQHDEDAEYGVRWKIIQRDGIDPIPRVYNYPIEYFPQGRSLIINIVNYMWDLKPFTQGWLPVCHDYTKEFLQVVKDKGDTTKKEA